jgi:hypothetical protein
MMASRNNAGSEYHELLPDYSDLFESGCLSDVNVIVREEHPGTEDAEDEQAAKRPRMQAPQTIIPAHKVVLWGMSKFFKAKVKRPIPGDQISHCCLWSFSRSKDNQKQHTRSFISETSQNACDLLLHFVGCSCRTGATSLTSRSSCHACSF